MDHLYLQNIYTTMNKDKYIYKTHNGITWNLDGGWIVLAIIPLVLPLFIYMKTGKCDYVLWAILIGILIVSPLILLSLISRFSYSYLNHNDTFIHNRAENLFIFCHNKKEIKFYYEDIGDVLMCTGIKSPDTNFIRLPWEDYTHIVIRLKNGKSFILSSLIFPEIEAFIFKDKLKVYKSIFRTAWRLEHLI